MDKATTPTRFLHTPGIGTTTYLISDTTEGRALAANTPEDSPRLRRQHLAARAARPLGFAALAVMGFAGGSTLCALLGFGTPAFSLGGTLVFIVIAFASLTCRLYATDDHRLQEHLLHTNRHIAQPFRYNDGDMASLPLTVRGVPTLTVLSRAADAGNMGPVYVELAYPGYTHSGEVEAALADYTHP